MVAAEALQALAPLVKQYRALQALESILSDIVKFDAKANECRNEVQRLESEVEVATARAETDKAILLTKFSDEVKAAGCRADSAREAAEVVKSQAAKECQDAVQGAREAAAKARDFADAELGRLAELRVEIANLTGERDALVSEIAAVREKVAALLG